MDTESQAPLDLLREAVKRAGGLMDVARALEVSHTHLSNVINGHRPIGQSLARKLRTVLLDVPASVWGELLTAERGDEAVA
jgi:plasmid maintenance system antidote protein VapI